MAGLPVNQSNSIGGSTNVILRGYKSLLNDNQALFVIDGVPFNNSNNNSSGKEVGADIDYGNASADVNPDDIASISVLKGAAASAFMVKGVQWRDPDNHQKRENRGLVLR